ncbi:MAG: PmoA family protein [Verrucomicrobia bacterium]|nr:PmoA family protein [Verrucomicrobiota bacterium]
MNIRICVLTCLTLLSFQCAGAPFRFADVDDKSLGLWEGTRPVLVYNHGVISKADVAADRARSSYIHPIYGLDGEVLTDDFPKDHFHHRGLFWSWPHVKVGDKQTDLWMLKGIRHEFGRWLSRDAGEKSAVLGVQNGWFIGERKVVDEQVWLRVLPATAEGQALDVELVWIPIDEPLTLRGAPDKSYGGLTLRFAPHKGKPVITTSEGVTPKDLTVTRLPWADLSAQFDGANAMSGATIFVDPAHPDYPPEWLTRHYGVLCVGWPGVEEQTFQPGEPIRCRYRVWIHRGVPDSAKLKSVEADYKKQIEGAPPLSAQTLKAKLESDRVTVNIDGELFTEYLFRDDEKYPFFYPVNGPRTGRSVTEKRLENYPHHSSLFFGCDYVNDGNYWQEGLERGRIVSKSVKVLRDSGHEIAFEQHSVWERPGAEAPFDDIRKIRVSAPSRDLRYIDFEIKLTARIKVRIKKTNHSLFTARMAPELAVVNGGQLRIANGDANEKGTFGQTSPWADYRGMHHGETEGVAILCHPSSRWFPAPWFTRDYGLMSPTPLYWLENGFVEFEPGETIELQYRVLVHAGNPGAREIQSEFESWAR